MYIYERPKNKYKTIKENAEPISDFDYTSVHRSKQYMEAVNKFFDISDSTTRKVLLSVNEVDQNLVMTSLANKLYDHIVNKVDDIDFGTIPESRGDITKIENYDKLLDCINIIAEILQAYHQDTSTINTVSVALQNMVDRKELFMKAFKLNVEMPVIIYNTITLAIVSSVSFMIASCIEFVKVSDTEGFDIAVNKTSAIRTKDCVLYKDLSKFNKICADGSFDKAMDFVIRQSVGGHEFTGADIALFGVSGGPLVIGAILLIIPIIRELIFFFYYSRYKISDYFDTQASLLTMNAYNIENNLTRNDKNKKEIVRKQRKIADTFKKIANTFAIKTKTGESKAEKDVAKLDKEKYKSSDVLSDIPDSANSVLF